MGPYTEKAYEISLSRKIFKSSDKKDIPSRSFNLFYFFSMILKGILSLCNCCDPDWPKTQTFIDSSEEVSNQIDISYIVRRLMFFDAAIAKLMERHEI